jgi:Aldehyde dehydrogenase family
MELSGSHPTPLCSPTTSFTKFAVKQVFRQESSTLFQLTDLSLETQSRLHPILLESISRDLSRMYISQHSDIVMNLVPSLCSTFNRLWAQVGKNINSYKNFPRLIGECGGKNFHFIHPTADVTSVVNGSIRSAFEYCGQKCSACSRMYVPESLWPKVCNYPR